MQPLLLIQTGEAPEPIYRRHGGYADWFRGAMRLEAAQMAVVHVDDDEPLPEPADVAGAVITGSGAMVTEHADWSERTADWIRTATHDGVPLFGVCYGHQLMAHALGGKVGWLPAGREIGSETMTRESVATEGDWNQLPRSFPAQTTHRQAVLKPPAGAEVLAHSNRDPYQLLRYAPHVLSSQFHPEFSVEHMRAFIATRAATLREEGLDPDALADAVVPTEVARTLLEGFAHTALSGERAAA